MISSELTPGRRIGVVLQPGDDVIPSIVAACGQHGIRQGYIPVFLGAFRSVRLIASDSPIADPEPPLPASVEVAYTEGTGSGSIVWNEATDAPHVHLHVAVGAKDAAGAAVAGHLLAATTHYVVELVIEEVLAPRFLRVADEAAHGLENLRFEG